MKAYVTLHDSQHATKRRPQGRVMRVAADSIDTIRPYESGLTRCVLGINGNYLHVTETEQQVVTMIEAYIIEGVEGSDA